MLTVFKSLKIVGKSIIWVAAIFWLFGLTPVQDICTLTLHNIIKGQHFFADTFGLNQTFGFKSKSSSEDA